MLAWMMASMMVATATLCHAGASLAGQPTRYCRNWSAPLPQPGDHDLRERRNGIGRDVPRVTRYAHRASACSLSGLPTGLTPFPLNEDSRILCKVMKMTGSRLRSTNLCLPKREWDRMHDNSREEVSDLQDNYSKRTPGEQ